MREKRNFTQIYNKFSYLILSPHYLTPSSNPMNGFTLNALLLSAIAFPAVTHAQLSEPTSFTIGKDTYFLHRIAQHDLSANIPDYNTMWNESIIADNKYIYIADHTKNSASQLVIKRYNALDGSPSEDLIISEEEMYKFDIDLMTDNERCFSLVDLPGNDYFILFLGPNENGIESGSEFYFYLIDKNGYIERKFIARTNRLDTNFMRYGIADFGIPEFIGDPIQGNFEMLLPIYGQSGDVIIADYKYTNFEQTGSLTVFSDFNRKNRFTKPSVCIIDDSYMIVDDVDIKPSIYSYTSNQNQCFGQLDDNNVRGHGCRWFDLDGHRLLYSGDIYYSDNDNSNGITQFNIGLWDLTDADARSNSPINFDNYETLANLQFGQSSFNSKEMWPYTYRQFMAVSDYGNSTKHLHFYVPGEFLATYQLNRHDTPTSVETIDNLTDRHDISISVCDKKIIFDRPIDNVRVFNMTGTLIFHSVEMVTSINLSNLVKGVYIIATSHNSYKIIL